MLVKLWTFENKAKLDLFASVLQNHDIAFEVLTKGMQENSDSGVVVSVDDSDYEEAKKLLVKYRRKNTNRHYT
jgi:hypothetical protein